VVGETLRVEEDDGELKDGGEVGWWWSMMVVTWRRKS